MSDDQEKDIQNFQQAFSLGGSAPHPDEVTESFEETHEGQTIDEIADEIQSDLGPEKRMSLEDANAIMGRQTATAPAEELDAGEEAEEEVEEGSRSWAMRLVRQYGEQSGVETQDDGDGMVSLEVANLRTQLAVKDAEQAQRLRQAESELADDDDDDDEVEDFDPAYYTSPEVIEMIAENYDLGEKEAGIVAKVSGVMIQHYHENVVQPRQDQRDIDQDEAHRTSMNADNERETLNNFSQALNYFEQNGNELEKLLVEQTVQHGMERSFLGQYLMHKDNRFMATNAQSLVDATETVARRVVTQADKADTGLNRKSKRAPVGEQTHATIGRAVRRGPTARKAKTVDADSLIRAAIRNSGRPALPAFMGRG